jgi:hypothetical protein
MYKPKSKNRRFEEGRRQKVRQPPKKAVPVDGGLPNPKGRRGFFQRIGTPSNCRP